ncbi:Uncharacterized conserved protein YloU, alkaline shock protein (Asp23) family [Amycolatopsis arida]|uniref:Uncharacterized conserved protein YloU, alkaline shock protein (Asp23) family n=1 Tax=Amycolatopsis arida TaxID=587909 RepID=A0A1I5T6Y2_9PSEU|nr:Asp23/Gls24 family envelope stress response protein [Amycolatopsis arida]TDX96208.1 putative alkaline shock family protein YloU [Amycolatopsis arida]SFP78728.1 Uncharacterized conserved protein YloU, alkaline shock protein (Asp23) family [Amycolatopsis arida]
MTAVALDAGLADRGRTTLEPKAVERLAAHALSEVAGVRGVARRVLGVTVGEGDSAPRVSARVDGDDATLDVRLAVAYPASVAATTERARAHLVRRVGELTGLAVRRIDVEVAVLRRDAPVGRRVR